MKWEYKTIKMRPNSFFVEADRTSFESIEVDKFIDQLGREGWELVSTSAIVTDSARFVSDTTVIILFFKRPLADET